MHPLETLNGRDLDDHGAFDDRWTSNAAPMIASVNAFSDSVIARRNANNVTGQQEHSFTCRAPRSLQSLR
jgi:hypothetical protein